MNTFPRLLVGAATAAIVTTGLLQASTASAAPAPPPGPAPAAAVTSPLGSSINTLDDVARISGLMGRQLTSARVFLNQPPATWTKSALLNSVPENGTVAVSFRSGTPAQVQTFLAGHPADTKCYATYYHEPEVKFTTPAAKAQYKAAWDAYAPAIRAAHCIPTMILMKWSLNSHSNRNWHDWYFANDMDVIAFDAYDTALNRGGYADPTTYLAPILAASAEVGRPWALTEVGSFASGSAAQRAAWAQAVAHLSMADGGLFANWWDHTSIDGTKDFTLDAATAQAWHQ